MNQLRTISRSLLLALVPFIMLLFHNQVSNWHYHVLSNGIVVKHAHPYNKAEDPNSPVSGHSHSDFEFFILGQLSNLALLLVLIIIAVAFSHAQMHKLVYDRYRFPFLQQQSLSLRFLRAPPH